MKDLTIDEMVKNLKENTIYKNSSGTIYWTMVIESISSNDKHKALHDKEYYKCVGDYEEECLADAKKVANDLIDNSDYDELDVTYILYDQHADELLKIVDDVLIRERY